MGRVRVSSRIIPWSNAEIAKLDVRVLQVATDIDRVAKLYAPHATGALRNSAQIVRKGLGHYAVVFGGGSVPYARRRHYENKLNPGTLRYLQRAGDNTARNVGRYFKGV